MERIIMAIIGGTLMSGLTGGYYLGAKTENFKDYFSNFMFVFSLILTICFIVAMLFC